MAGFWLAMTLGYIFLFGVESRVASTHALRYGYALTLKMRAASIFWAAAAALSFCIFLTCSAPSL